MARLFLILLIPIYFLQAAVIIDKEPIDLELNEVQIYIDDNLTNTQILDKNFEALPLPQSIGVHKDKNVWIKI